MAKPVKDPLAMLILASGSVLLLLAVLFLLSSLASTISQNSVRHGPDTGLSSPAVEQNLKPLGTVVTVDKTIAPKVRSGQEIFAATCTACHTSGVLGAPKLDQADWTARIGNGLQGLMNSALQGKGQMPARGGNPSLTDEEVQAAVNYMLDQAGVKLAN